MAKEKTKKIMWGKKEIIDMPFFPEEIDEDKIKFIKKLKKRRKKLVKRRKSF